jgi:hypothetical protein
MFIVTNNAVTATCCETMGSAVHLEQMFLKNKCAILFYIKSVSSPLYSYVTATSYFKQIIKVHKKESKRDKS